MLPSKTKCAKIEEAYPTSSIPRAKEMTLYQHKGIVQHVVDGDTLDIIADLRFFITCPMRLQIEGVDISEIRGPERPESLRARDLYGRYITNLFFRENNR